MKPEDLVPDSSSDEEEPKLELPNSGVENRENTEQNFCLPGGSVEKELSENSVNADDLSEDDENNGISQTNSGETDKEENKIVTVGNEMNEEKFAVDNNDSSPVINEKLNNQQSIEFKTKPARKFKRLRFSDSSDDEKDENESQLDSDFEISDNSANLQKPKKRVRVLSESDESE